MGFLRKLIDSEYKELKKFESIAKEIDNLSEEMANLSDEELKNKTQEFKEILKENNNDLESIIIPAFAVAREAASRVIGEKPYFVQILGGLAIHYGNIAEMKTGEGKTLTETMPAYLNALTGKGVHIITVNEFLADRDSKWMGNIFRFLGLTVGLNLRELSPEEKKAFINAARLINVKEIKLGGENQQSVYDAVGDVILNLQDKGLNLGYKPKMDSRGAYQPTYKLPVHDDYFMKKT